MRFIRSISNVKVRSDTFNKRLLISIYIESFELAVIVEDISSILLNRFISIRSLVTLDLGDIRS